MELTTVHSLWVNEIPTVMQLDLRRIEAVYLKNRIEEYADANKELFDHNQLLSAEIAHQDVKLEGLEKVAETSLANYIEETKRFDSLVITLDYIYNIFKKLNK